MTQPATQAAYPTCHLSVQQSKAVSGVKYIRCRSSSKGWSMEEWLSGSKLRVVRPGRTQPRPQDLHLAVITVDRRDVGWIALGDAQEFIVNPGLHEIGVRLRFSLERSKVCMNFAEGGQVTVICDVANSVAGQAPGSDQYWRISVTTD